MARTVRNSTLAVTAGIAPAYTAVDNVNGEQIVFNGRKTLHVKNANAGSLTVTVRSAVAVDGQALTLTDRVVTLLTGTDKFIGLNSPSFMQSDGNDYIDYSLGASVTAALLEV